MGFLSLPALMRRSPEASPRGAENSVVLISAKVIVPILREKDTIIATGTGFALRGKIYKCEHVVSDSQDITVTLRSGKVLPAKILRTNKDTDLAELGTDEVPPSLVLRDRPPRVLEKVWEIGNPTKLRWVTTSG